MDQERALPAIRATLAQLRSFETVARLRAVGRAAAQLHLAQPTVSSQLRELAAATGLQLLEPEGRGVRLTDEGALLADTVRELYAVWQRFEEELAERRGLKSGLLRLAAVTTTEYFLPELVGPFAHAHPGIDIELAVQNRDAVVQRLREGSAELAVMMLPPPELPLLRWPLMENPLVLVAPRGHPLAALHRVPLARLTREPRLAREDGSGTRLATDQFLAAKGVEWPTRMALGSNEALKHAVAAGLGLAVLSRHSLGDAPASLVELKAAGFPIRRQWFVVWRSDRRLSRAAKALLSAWQARGRRQAKPS
jgi:LysR family transcriptional regulator, low CO2-responsive transcriptional regulator